MRRTDLFFMAAAMTAVTVVGPVSGQTTPPLTYTSTGVESNWALPGAWECIDDLGQPCSGQPGYPPDADHQVVIEHPVFLDLRGSTLEIGRLNISENGSAGSLTVENTGGAAQFIVGETGLLDGSTRIGEGGFFSVECGAEVVIEDELKVEGGGTLEVFGKVLVKKDMIIKATSNLQADRGLASVQGACAVLEIESNLFVRGDLEVFGDGPNEALVDVHHSVTVEAMNDEAIIDGWVEVGDGSDHGRLTVGEILTLKATSDRVAYGTIVVDAGSLVLTMENATGTQHPVGGQILLSSEESELLVLDDAEIVAYQDGGNEIPGEIRGQDEGAELKIADGREFTLGEEMLLSGALTLSPEFGTADFVNRGIFQADDASGWTLSLGESLNISDGVTAPYGEWKASALNATLEFNESADLNGDFVLTDGGRIRVTAGTAQDPKEVVTTGTVIPDPYTSAADGCIEAEPNACFYWDFNELTPPFVCDDEVGVCP